MNYFLFDRFCILFSNLKFPRVHPHLIGLCDFQHHCFAPAPTAFTTNLWLLLSPVCQAESARNCFHPVTMSEAKSRLNVTETLREIVEWMVYASLSGRRRGRDHCACVFCDMCVQHPENNGCFIADGSPCWTARTIE